MSGLTELSKKSGVHVDVIQSVFSNILSMVATGDDVKINGIGTFKRRLFAGRTLKTPLLTKPIKYGDSYVLKFHQSALAKAQLNALAKGEEPPEKKKVGAKPKAKPEPVETEVADETDIPRTAAKKGTKKAAAPVAEAKPAPVKKTTKKTEEPAKPLKKKAAPPPAEEDDEEELEESEEETDDETDEEEEE